MNAQPANRPAGVLVSWGSQFLPYVAPGTRFTRIAGGEQHNLALKPDGTVVAWGRNEYNQCDVPANLGGVVAIAVGRFHNLALKWDGTVAAWGVDSSGESSVPSGLSNVVAIAAGVEHSLALKSDGTVVGWGGAPFGNVVPRGLRDVVAISSQGTQNLALKSDGSVVAWHHTSELLDPVPVEATNVVAISAGENHNLVLRQNGTVVDWYSYSVQSFDLPPGLENVIAVAAGRGFSLALKRDGSVLGWGNNDYGQITIPPRLSGVIAITASTFHGFALKDDGSFVSWGFNPTGIPNLPPLSARGFVAMAAGGSQTVAVNSLAQVWSWGLDSPGQVQGIEDAISVASGDAHSVALRSDGTVRSWGWFSDNGQNVHAIGPTDLTNVVAIAAGRNNDLALKTDGTVVAWNGNGYENVPAGLTNIIAIAAGETQNLALGDDRTVVAWNRIDASAGRVPAGLSNVVAIAAGWGQSLALRADGAVVAWGINDQIQVSVPEGLHDVSAISAYGDNNLALRADGSVVAWSVNQYTHSQPFPFSGGRVFAISAGYSHDLALFAPTNEHAPVIVAQPASQSARGGDRVILQVAVEGDPLFYQWRKNGTNIPGATFPFFGMTNAQSADAGEYSVLITNPYAPAGVLSSNAVLAVVPTFPMIQSQPQDQITLSGGNVSFRVVVGGSEPFRYQWLKDAVPIPGATNSVLNLLNVQLGNAGNYSVRMTNSRGPTLSANAVLRIGPALSPPHPNTRGVVVEWGIDDRGRRIISPKLSNIVAIAAGSYHSLAIRADGTVVAWGSNDQHQSDVPPGLTNVVAVAAGPSHSLALRSDGTVASWGGITFGGSELLTPPTDLSNVVAIAAGSGRSLALKSDGKIVAWGGTTGEASSTVLPAVPGEISGIVAISAGYDYNLALRYDGVVFAWGAWEGPPSEANILRAGLSDVVEISAGYLALARFRDGSGVSWNRTDIGHATELNGLDDMLALSAGKNHNFVVRSDGTVFGWGFQIPGRNSAPAGLSRVLAVAVGDDHNLALVTPAVLPVRFGLARLNESEGSFQTTLFGPDGGQYVLQISTDLAHWTDLHPVGTSAAGTPVLQLDPSAQRRFYRVRALAP